MLVGSARQFVEPAAGQFAEAMEVRLEMLEIVRREIEPEQVAQAAIDGVEILAGAFECEMIGALRPGDSGGLRSVRRVHA
jgi:hypothetical protein